MDIYKEKYYQKEFEEYILGSAEVVGLMCLRIYSEGDEKVYNELKESAIRLGSDLQKINLLRDLNAEYRKLGRSYFPGFTLAKFDELTTLLDKRVRIPNRKKYGLLFTSFVKHSFNLH